MTPRYTSPREAVIGLLDAYRAFEIDRIVENKDFESDARIYWESLSLPASADRLAKTRLTFENNFRKQLQSGIPNYGDVHFEVVSEEQLQSSFVVVTLAGAKADGDLHCAGSEGQSPRDLEIGAPQPRAGRADHGLRQLRR